MYKTIIYDAYGTLFDVASTDKALKEFYPEQAHAVGALWRKKQIEYAFLRQMTGTYKPFSEVTEDALRYALEVETGSKAADVVERGMKSYELLDLFPEVKEVLEQQQAVNAILSNGSRDMLEPLIAKSTIASHMHEVLSIDDIKQYKPSQAAYQYALHYFEGKREEILFISSNTWDIIGAKTFGFDTLWINRGGTPFESGHIQPDYTGENLKALLEI